MVIVLGNEHERSEFKSWTKMFAFHLHANALRKGMNPFLFPSAIGKKIG